MNYYVMADIHGFYSEMIKALEESGYYKDTEQKKIIICGDLFDRGTAEETLKLQDYVVDLIEKDEVILIRGNHEDLIEELVRNLEKHTKDGMLAFTHHAHNKTTHTLSYLTGIIMSDFAIRPEAVRAKFYNTPLYKKILPKMVDYYETEHYIFVHGWLPCYMEKDMYGQKKYFYIPDWRDAAKMEWDYARWYNGIEAARQGVKEPGKTIVCGHYHCSYGHMLKEGTSEFGVSAKFTPFYDDGIIAIDACTAYSGRVNCVKLTDSLLEDKK